MKEKVRVLVKIKQNRNESKKNINIQRESFENSKSERSVATHRLIVAQGPDPPDPGGVARGLDGWLVSGS